MEKKKILFVIDSLGCGGAEKSLVTLLRFIDYNQFEIDLQLHSRGGVFENLVPPAVTIQTVEIKQGYFKLKYIYARFSFKWLRLLNRNKKSHSAQLYWQSFGTCHSAVDKKYDIAIAYGQGFSTYFVAQKVDAKIKYSWLNNDYIKAGYNLAFDIPFYSLFDKIVVVSDENEKVFQQCCADATVEFPTIVIRDIVDEVEINSKASIDLGFVNDKAVFNIVTVGRLTPQKGLSLAVKACKILKDKGKEIVWYVVGEGEERKNIQDLVERNGLEKSFILLGLKENPYPYVLQADLYVQSSIYEGLCITLIEARLLKKRIVTTNFPSAYGIIKQEETGVICEMNSASIAQSILRYMEDNELNERIIGNLASQVNTDKEEALVTFSQLINLAL